MRIKVFLQHDARSAKRGVVIVSHPSVCDVDVP